MNRPLGWTLALLSLAACRPVAHDADAHAPAPATTDRPSAAPTAPTAPIAPVPRVPSVPPVAPVALGDAASARLGDAPAVVEPGARLGPFTLGMTPDQARAVGLPTSLSANLMGQLFGSAGPFALLFERNALVSVSVDLAQLPRGARFGERVVTAPATFGTIESALQDCQPNTTHPGYVISTCNGGTFDVGRPANAPATQLFLRVRRANVGVGAAGGPARGPLRPTATGGFGQLPR